MTTASHTIENLIRRSFYGSVSGVCSVKLIAGSQVLDGEVLFSLIPSTSGSEDRNIFLQWLRDLMSESWDRYVSTRYAFRVLMTSRPWTAISDHLSPHATTEFRTGTNRVYDDISKTVQNECKNLRPRSDTRSRWCYRVLPIYLKDPKGCSCGQILRGADIKRSMKNGASGQPSQDWRNSTSFPQGSSPYSTLISATKPLGGIYSHGCYVLLD